MSKSRRKAGELFGAPQLRPKTDKQKEYLNALRCYPQVFAVGPAGTGKTFLPSALAADMLREKQIAQIILSKPNVPAGPSIGYFPGTLVKKMAPWVAPMMQTIADRLGPGPTEYAINKGVIEIVPFETMRGRSFESAFIIIDEGQNLTPHEMEMVTTRIGEESKLVVTGDLDQVDIECSSGLDVAVRLVRTAEIDAAVVEFTEEDVVRSVLCRQWVKAWNTHSNSIDNTIGFLKPKKED